MPDDIVTKDTLGVETSPLRIPNLYLPMPKFDPQIHRRRSIRLKGYDYAQAGAYFVTIVAWHRESLFGEVINGEMILNQRGRIAVECWQEIPNHFPSVELGANIVMPNHIHGIIIIRDVGATHASPLRKQLRGVSSRSLGAIIGSYKSAVSKRIGRELNEIGIWQRNYYEHILRNDKDLKNKTDYILANPLLWEQDDENPVHGNNR